MAAGGKRTTPALVAGAGQILQGHNAVLKMLAAQFILDRLLSRVESIHCILKDFGIVFFGTGRVDEKYRSSNMRMHLYHS